jgi:hypothetical protein
MDLVKAAAKALRVPVLEELAGRNSSRANEAQGSDLFVCDPLDEVPYEVSNLLVDPNRLLNQSKAAKREGDPCREIAEKSARLLLMIGEAGLGKTTVALRSLSSNSRGIIYARAATITSLANGKGLLEGIFNLAAVVDSYDDNQRGDVAILAHEVAEALLRTPDSPLALVLDGLDESTVVAKERGMQRLANCLRDFAIPVVLIARKEFWLLRKADFASAIGDIARIAEPRRFRMTMVELLPWCNKQIANLAQRYRGMLTEPVEQSRLDEFVTLVLSNEYEAIYGDIPRRPLFLAMLLNWVRGFGATRANRVALVEHLISAKVARDVVAPLAPPGEGRLAILPDVDSIEQTQDVAWHAMRLAPGYPTRRRTETHHHLAPGCPTRRRTERPPPGAG